jgi:hypothetical protein
MINEKLFKAVETGKADEVEKALTEENINTSTYYGVKTIVLATEQGNSEVLRMLLKNGEKTPREIFWRRSAYPALSAAFKDINPSEVLDVLLEYGAGADKMSLVKSAGKTKLYYEDGIYLPIESTKEYVFVQCAREGKITDIKDLLITRVSHPSFSVSIHQKCFCKSLLFYALTSSIKLCFIFFTKLIYSV